MAEEKNKTAMQLEECYLIVKTKDRLPKFTGDYIAKMDYGDRKVATFKKGKGWTDEKGAKVIVTSWLDYKQERVVMTKEEFEKAIRDAFHAGRDREFDVQFGPVPPKTPSADNYIKSLYE